MTSPFLNGPASFGPLGNAAPSNAGASNAFNFATGAMGSGSDVFGTSNANGFMMYAPWIIAAGLAVWIIAKK